jgi:hypothetical protein
MKSYDLFDNVRHCLGDKMLLEEIMQVLDSDTYNNILYFIARVYDLPLFEEENEEE